MNILLCRGVLYCDNSLSQITSVCISKTVTHLSKSFFIWCVHCRHGQLHQTKWSRLVFMLIQAVWNVCRSSKCCTEASHKPKGNHYESTIDPGKCPFSFRTCWLGNIILPGTIYYEFYSLKRQVISLHHNVNGNLCDHSSYLTWHQKLTAFARWTFDPNQRGVA